MTFSRQNDAGSRARTTWYWKTQSVALVVVLALESKALYSLRTQPLLPTINFPWDIRTETSNRKKKGPRQLLGRLFRIALHPKIKQNQKSG